MVQYNKWLLTTLRVLAGTLLEMETYPDAKTSVTEHIIWRPVDDGWRGWSCVNLKQSRVFTNRKRNHHPEATKKRESHYPSENKQSSERLEWSSFFGEEPGFDAGRVVAETLSECWGYTVFADGETVDPGIDQKGRTQFYGMVDNRGQTTWRMNIIPQVPMTSRWDLREVL